MRRLPVPLELLASPLFAQEKEEMLTYSLAILEKGPKWDSAKGIGLRPKAK